MKRFAKSIIRWLTNSKILSFPRRIFVSVVTYAFSNKNALISYYNEPDKAQVLGLIRQIKSKTDMLLRDNEAYQLFINVRGTKKIEGDIAEVGVYSGGSARLICEAKGSKHLHLFDTFEGLPEVREIDTFFHKGQYVCSLECAKECLKNFPNVHFYKGMFPVTVTPVRDKIFSFVHLDVDLYKSTLDCLEFFYPRLSPGGLIMSHDYVSGGAVKLVFDSFFKDKPEPIIQLLEAQCLVVKI